MPSKKEAIKNLAITVIFIRIPGIFSTLIT